MLIKFNESGTHIKNGKLKIRFDIYPDVNSKTHKDQYVDVPSRPYEGAELEKDETGVYTPAALALHALVPKVKQLNPFLCMFFTVPPSLTKPQLLTFLVNNYGKSLLDQLDTIISENTSSRLNEFLKGKMVIGEVPDAVESDIVKINKTMRNFERVVK
jgi:hypothetical protein